MRVLGVFGIGQGGRDLMQYLSREEALQILLTETNFSNGKKKPDKIRRPLKDKGLSEETPEPGKIIQVLLAREIPDMFGKHFYRFLYLRFFLRNVSRS